MSISPILALHIVGGTVGFLSGCVAVIFRKGSRRHALAGSVFVISMLTLTATGVFMAVMKSQPGNILGGSLTFYLVLTAWMTARRREGDPGIFDWAALLVVLAVLAAEITFGIQAAISPTGRRFGYPIGPYAFLGSVALLAVVGDIRMLVRRGVSGTQRLARHLWRMNFAWFIASASIFLARPHLFPMFFRKSGILVLLTVLPLVMLIFWFVRVKFTGAFRRNIPPAETDENRPITDRPVSA